MNFDDAGDRIREVTADILIETKRVWVDCDGHVYMGSTSDGVFEVDLKATELFELVQRIMCHPEFNSIVVARKIRDGSDEPIKKEICNHMFNGDQFYEVRRILRRRFIADSKASGIIVNPSPPSAAAVAMRIMDDCETLANMVNHKHHEAIRTLRNKTWCLLDIIDPVSDEDEE